MALKNDFLPNVLDDATQRVQARQWTAAVPFSHPSINACLFFCAQSTHSAMRLAEPMVTRPLGVETAGETV